MSKEILMDKLRKLVAVCDQVSVPLPKSRRWASQKEPKLSVEFNSLSKRSLRNPLKSLPRMLQTWFLKIKIKFHRLRPNFLDIKLKRRLLWNLSVTSRVHMQPPKRRIKRQNHRQMQNSKKPWKRPKKQLRKPPTNWPSTSKRPIINWLKP